MEAGYRVAGADCRTEFTERKSRFITTLRRVHTRQEADNFIAEVRQEFPDATHHCVAYRIHTPLIERFSDDGEPGGTAGMPMLEVLKKQELFDTALVVTRYFGGVLLGAGGLVRAYARGASDAVQQAGVRQMQPAVRLRLICGYGLVTPVQRMLDRYTHTGFSAEYGAEVLLALVLRAEELPAFSAELAELSAGGARLEQAETLLCAF